MRPWVGVGPGTDWVLQGLGEIDGLRKRQNTYFPVYVWCLGVGSSRTVAWRRVN